MKIAIVMAVGHVVQPKTSHALAVMAYHVGRHNPEINLDLGQMRTCYVQLNRNDLIRKMLAAGCDAFLWVDSDQTFPPDAVSRLLSRNLPIVGATYRNRQPPHPYMLPLLDPGEAAAPLRQVAYLPGGFHLIRREVFEKLPFPWYRADYGLLGEPPDVFTGEDVYFFAKARDAGYEIWCDLELTEHIGHVVEVELNTTNQGHYSAEPQRSPA